MSDIVIVPCYERPEFTTLCLEYLSRADGIEEKNVWLCQDQHFGSSVSSDVLDSVVELGQDLFKERFRHRLLEPHGTYGNSVNLLESLKAAHRSGARRIFLVEDDIMVTPDFFKWHEAILEEPQVFVSCATAVNKSAHFPINGRYAMDESFQDPNAYYLSATAYSSHAAAFKRNNLGMVLSRLANDGIYETLQSGNEQDILIQKLLPETGLESAWPYVPRAFNVGFYSYHISGQKILGSFNEKVQLLRNIIQDPATLKTVAFGNQAVTPVPAGLPLWGGPVRNVQRYK